MNHFMWGFFFVIHFRFGNKGDIFLLVSPLYTTKIICPVKIHYCVIDLFTEAVVPLSPKRRPAACPRDDGVGDDN